MKNKKLKAVCLAAIAVLIAGGIALSVGAAKNADAFAGRGAENYTKAAVLSGSLADMWMDAGGTVTCATQDALADKGLNIPADAVNAGSLVHPNPELVIGSGAKLVILSAEIPGQKKLAGTFRKAGLKVLTMDIESFQDYLKGLKQLTALTGRKDLYRKNGTDVEKRITKTVARVQQLNEQSRGSQGQKAKKVLLLRAFSRGVSAKNSTDSMTGAMLKDLGCINIADSDASLLENLSMEKILQEDPDYIFIVPMGDSGEAMAEVSKRLASTPAWKSLSAVKNKKVIDLPKDLFQLKPNERWDESYAMLEKILCSGE